MIYYVGYHLLYNEILYLFYKPIQYATHSCAGRYVFSDFELLQRQALLVAGFKSNKIGYPPAQPRAA